MTQAILWAAGGTGFVFLMTMLGSALVFVLRRQVKSDTHKIMLGFAAGVMIAAAIWSLLIPAIEEAGNAGWIGWIPVVGGFVLGVAFFIIIDSLLPHIHPVAKRMEGLPTSWKRSTLLVTAVMLHNIPEGMAVGLAFALAAQHGDPALYASAVALCIGIGMHNFPEGAAVSLLLRQEGMHPFKAFLFGSISGVVEPVFGILVVLVAGGIEPLMPWFLSFAAGAMLYVVVEEVLPEARLGEHSNKGTLSVLSGFLIMMILDVVLGG